MSVKKEEELKVSRSLRRGRDIGKRKEKESMILNMFEQDIPIETIAVVASLSINEVKQIHDLIHYV